MTEYSFQIQLPGDVRYVKTTHFRLEGEKITFTVDGREWPVGEKANIIGGGAEYKDDCCRVLCYFTFLNAKLESVSRTLNGYSLRFSLN